jgi:hypothetical protein
MLGITTTNARVGGFRGGISAEAKTIYNRIIADGGVSNLSRLNFFVKGLKAIYGDLANVPVCYDAHWIGYKLGSGTGATAGQAAAKLYSLTVAGDAVQTTAASQPLLLAHNGDNYWWGSGVSGNYVSTPNAAANIISGNLEITAYRIDTKNTTGSKYILSKVNTYSLSLSAGLLAIEYRIGGAILVAFSSITIPSSFFGSVRVFRNATTGDINFYTSTDNINFTQLGTTISGTSGVIQNLTNDVFVGSYNNALGIWVAGIGRVTIATSLGGTPVVDFNPATYNAATSQTAWTSTTGEVWTISTGTATSGYKGVLVDRTIVQSDGVDDQLKTTSLSITISTRYASINPFVATSGYMIAGALIAIGDKQLFYYTGTTPRAYSSASFINFVGVNSNKLQLFQATFNGASSQVSINNANNTTGTLLADSYDTLVLFSNLSAAYKNMVLTTLVQSNLADDATNRTATYNLIRSLNNNAF